LITEKFDFIKDLSTNKDMDTHSWYFRCTKTWDVYGNDNSCHGSLGYDII